jgi:hypothetical protein
MKLEQVKRNVTSSGTMEVSTAKIKATAKLFDMFADQTYANKPVAILRELVANGIDAHIAAGKPEVPVEIQLPTEFDPMFKVKDFGTGMPHDFVMGPFMEYTNGSTKDQSNDQIGGFGIGSKSPFAYCDQFTLRVTHDGVLSVYTMFKNDESIPAIGLQGQTTTDESNGVEVSFPVEVEDITQFQEAAQQALQYFQPLPIVQNGKLTPPDYTHISVGGHWAMKASPDGTLGVIMGGVRYPVTSDALSYTLRSDSKLSPLLNYGIDITVPIGTCDVAMSREALSYTERTNEGITKALTNIVDEVAQTFAHLFDKYDTRWEASKALYEQIQAIGGNTYSGRNTPRAKMLSSFAKWKGKDLSDRIDITIRREWDHLKHIYVDHAPPGFPLGTLIWRVPQKTSWQRAFPNSKFEALEKHGALIPGALEVVFVDDMLVAAKSRTAARVREYFESNPQFKRDKESIVLRAKDSQNKAQVKAMLKFLGDPKGVVYLSTLPEPARVQRVIVKNGTTVTRPKVRMFTYNGERDAYNNQIINLSPAHAKRKVVFELAEADQPTTGVMVVMDNFNLPRNFRRKMELGLVKWEDLVFVNETDAKSLKKTFKTFDQVFDPKLEKFKKQYPDLDAQLAIYNDSALDNLFKIVGLIEKGTFGSIPVDKKSTAFGKITDAYNKYVKTFGTEAKALAALLETTPKMPSGLNTAKLAAEFKKDHPFADLVLTVARYNQDHPDTLRLFVHNL